MANWTQKVFDFILRNRSNLLANSPDPDYEFFSDKIVNYTIPNQISISTNSVYLRKWAFLFLLVGFFLLGWITGWFTFSRGISTLYFLPLPLLFIMPGIIYLRQSYYPVVVILNFEKRNIQFRKSAVSFSDIKYIYKSTVRYYRPNYSNTWVKRVPSWAVNMVDANGNVYVLVKSEDNLRVSHFINFLREKTGIEVRLGETVE